MNENKTGNFITALRKEKGLTQVQLAVKLNVTDKAVSRWETGKGMPDSSLLVPLANTLGVTVNELLTGERIPEEKFNQKSEDNLVTAVQKTEKAVNKGRMLKLFLSFAVIICVIATALAIKTVIDTQNTVIHEGSFDTRDRIDVTRMLLELDNSYFYYTENTVCTDYSIHLDNDGNIKSARIIMNDEFTHEKISLMLSSEDEARDKLSYSITIQRKYISAEDGILFTDLCEFLQNKDFIEICKKYSTIDDFDTINIAGQSTLYFNFDGQSHISFANQHLFVDGELIKVSNASGMNGKFYEVVIDTFETDTGANGHGYSVYVER